MAGKETPLSLIIQAIDKATAPLAEVTKAIDAAKKAAEGAGKEPKEATGLGRLVDGIRRAGDEVTTLAGKFLAFGRDAAAGIYSAVKGIAKTGAELAKLSARVGLSADDFEKLQLASGLDPQAFAQSLNAFEKGVALARIGKGRLAKQLDDESGGGISPALLRALKGSKSVEDRIFILTRAFGSLREAGERAALAKALGIDERFATVLAKGSGALTSRRNEIGRLLGSSNDFAASSLAITKGIKDAELAFEGGKRAALVAFYPAVKAAAEVVKEFFVGKRPAIEAFAKDFGQKLPGRIKAFVETIQEFRDKASSLVGVLGGWRDIGLAVAAVMGVKVVAAIYAVGAALVANPVGAVIAAVALAAYAVYRFWGPISGFFKGLWSSIGEVAGYAWNDIKEGASGAWGFLKGVWSSVSEVAGYAWDEVKEAASAAWSVVKGVWNGAGAFMASLWAAMRTAAGDAWDWLTGKVGAAADAVSEAWAPVKSFFQQLWDDVIGIFEGAWAKASAIVDRVASLPRRALAGIGGKISGLVDDIRNIGRSRGEEGGASAEDIINAPAATAPIFNPGAARPVPPEGARAQLKVVFENAPKGARVEPAGPSENTDLDLSLGYSSVVP